MKKFIRLFVTLTLSILAYNNAHGAAAPRQLPTTTPGFTSTMLMSCPSCGDNSFLTVEDLNAHRGSKHCRLQQARAQEKQARAQAKQAAPASSSASAAAQPARDAVVDEEVPEQLNAHEMRAVHNLLQLKNLPAQQPEEDEEQTSDEEEEEKKEVKEPRGRGRPRINAQALKRHNANLQVEKEAAQAAAASKKKRRKKRA